MIFSSNRTTKLCLILKQNQKYGDIFSTSEQLWQCVFDSIIGIHALLGWDTTSRVFSIGKGIALSEFQKLLSFLDKNASRAKVKGAAERPLASFYNDKVGNPFDQMCLSQFHSKMTTIFIPNIECCNFPLI